MLSLLKNTIKSLHHTYRQYLVLGILSVLLTSYLFVPAIAWIFNRVLRVFGSGYLVNSELLRLVLDWRTLLFFLAILMLIVLVFFIEFAVILVIAREAYHKRRVLLADAFSTALRRIPRILGLGSLQLLFLMALFSPFIDNPFFESLFGQINWPIFLRSQIFRSRLWMGLYATLVAAILYLVLRAIFSLHFIILSNQPMRKAIKYSFKMTKKRVLSTVFYLLIFNLVTGFLAFLIFTQMNRLPGLIGLRFSVARFENILMLVTSYLTFLTVMLLIPINMIFLTRLFYRYQLPDLPDDSHFKIHQNKSIGKLEKIIDDKLQRKKLTKHLILTACLVLTFILNFNIYQQASYLRWNVLVISHRGDMGSAPENSLSSMRSALEKSVDLIEIDLMLSSDGVLVLHHDQTLRRLAGRPERVADLTFEELSQIDIGSGYDPAFAGETIASLDQAIELIQEYEPQHSQLLLDLKPDGRWEEMAETVVETIEKYELEESCYVQSFNAAVIQAVRQKNETIRVGQVLSWAVGNLSALDVDFYAINKNMATEDFIRMARRDDRQVWVWTVNDEENMRKLLQFDIDGIITDYPERLQSLVALPAAPEPFLLIEDDELENDNNSNELRN